MINFADLVIWLWIIVRVSFLGFVVFLMIREIRNLMKRKKK